MATLRSVYRRPWRWLLVALVGVMVLVFLSGTIASDGGVPPSGLQQSVCGLMAVALVLLMVRVSRLAVVLDDSGVDVRNLFRDYKLLWSEIEGVEQPPPYGAWRNAGVRVRLKSGRIVSATAFSRGLIDSPSVGGEVVSALRDRLTSDNAPPFPQG